VSSDGRRAKATWPWWALAGLMAAWLLWMTLRPNPSVAQDLTPLTEPAAARGISPRVLIGVVGNAAVFWPLGLTLALALARHPARRQLVGPTLIGAGLSLAIELIQLALPSRVTALDDWLLNTAGTALGAWSGRWLTRRHRGAG
jgi:glycopeptide antibiotics resistance protein